MQFFKDLHRILLLRFETQVSKNKPFLSQRVEMLSSLFQYRHFQNTGSMLQVPAVPVTFNDNEFELVVKVLKVVLYLCRWQIFPM